MLVVSVRLAGIARSAREVASWVGKTASPGRESDGERPHGQPVYAFAAVTWYLRSLDKTGLIFQTANGTSLGAKVVSDRVLLSYLMDVR